MREALDDALAQPQMIVGPDGLAVPYEEVLVQADAAVSTKN